MLKLRLVEIIVWIEVGVGIEGLVVIEVVVVSWIVLLKLWLVSRLIELVGLKVSWHIAFSSKMSRLLAIVTNSLGFIKPNSFIWTRRQSPSSPVIQPSAS